MTGSTIFPAIILLFCLPSLSSGNPPPPPPNYQVSTPYLQLQNEEQVFFSPLNPDIVIANWRDFRLGYRQIGVGRSIDGGLSWSDSLVSPAMQKFMYQSDPALAVDADGTFYMAMLDFQPSSIIYWKDSSYITILKSIDNGLSWTGPVTVESGIGPYFEDKEFIAIDRTGGPYQGNLYVAWARYHTLDYPNRIMFARSINDASSFEDTLIIGPAQLCPDVNDSADAGNFAFPFVGSNGDVYVSWIGHTIDEYCYLTGHGLYLVKSIDGGRNFCEPRVVIPTFGHYGAVDGGVDVYNAPVAAVDISGGPFDGNLYITYANEYSASIFEYEYDIVFIRSQDGGTTWSEPYRVNDDRNIPGSAYDQFHPWMICNEDGILISIFYDQRTDSINHYKFDVFAAYSFDGGRSFTANHRISDTSISPGLLASRDQAGEKRSEIGSQTMAPLAGKIAEYIGVTAYHDQIIAVWTDTRNGNQDVYGANWDLPFLDPRLALPSDNDTLTTYNIIFDWSTDWKIDDDNYRLEIARDSACNDLVISRSLDSAQLTISIAGQHYGDCFWRVKAFRINEEDSTDYSESRRFYYYLCGDPNADGLVNLRDITYLINYLYKYGPEPKPKVSGDADGDPFHRINLQDITYLINYLYKQGLPPKCP